MLYFTIIKTQNILKNIQKTLFIINSYFKNKFFILLLLKNIQTIKNQIIWFRNIKNITNKLLNKCISGVKIVENIHKNINVAFGFTIVIKYQFLKHSL